MLRFKTYDATGLAPNGRLYAGDLNLLQDLVAAVSDFTQNLQVGSLAVGATDFMLTRFGTAEGSISSKLRVAGILRALSGLIAGTYTTTARDAIASGEAPYGLVILNTTTNRLEINLGTDAARNWQPMSQPIQRSTFAGFPAAGPSNINQIRVATDQNGGTPYYSDGSTWVKLAAGLTEAPTIPNGSIVEAKLAFDVATQAELNSHIAAADPHTGYRLESAPIVSGDIQNDTITDADIAPDTITARVIAPNAIGASELADGAVDSGAIQDGTIATADHVAGNQWAFSAPAWGGAAALGDNQSFDVIAPAAGSYILSFGAAQFHGDGQGAQGYLQDNVTGIQVWFANVSDQGQPVSWPVTLAAGQHVTVTFHGGAGKSLSYAWATLHRYA